MKNSWLFIHGGWGGSWQWSPVSKYLKENNIHSIAPTMPGMGLDNGSHITLDLYIEYTSKIMNQLKGPVNVAAFSFGGMTATALAGKYPEKINKLVYIDAFVPKPGQSFFDIAGEKITRQIKAYTDVMGDNKMIPPFFETDSRYCSHPMNTLFRNVSYSEKDLDVLNPTYIECVNKDPLWTFTPLLENTAKEIMDKDWRFHTIDSDHMPMFSHTEELCNLILDF